MLQYWHSGLGEGTQGGNQMDFYTLLDHVVDLLRQRQRVTYRALKAQFHLDDEILEALKEELVHGQRLATDEDGRVLVWTGDAGPTAPPPATLVQTPEHLPLTCRVEPMVTHPAPPQTRTCAMNAYGSSGKAFCYPYRRAMRVW